MTPTVLAELSTTVGPVLALNKPSGWVVHPDQAGAPALTAWLDAQGQSQLRPAHRLDRGTSGIVLCADAAGRAALGKWLADHAIQKTYLTLVYGKTRKKGTIRRALQDARRRRSLDAETRWRCQESLGAFSLLSVEPTTGRKHQIRRHLQGLGHAVIGDDRYRPRGRKTVPGFPGRLWLHAAKMVLPDGTVIEAPLPPALEEHLALLRARLVDQTR